MGNPPQLHTVVHQINQAVLTVVTEPRVRDNMGTHLEVPPAGLTGDTGHSLMADIMDTMHLQVTSPLVSTQKRSSGSRRSTQTAAASST